MIDGLTGGELLSAALTLLGAWSGLLIGIIKWFLNTYHKGLKEKFQGLSDQITANSKQSAERHELTNAAIRGQDDELRRIDREFLGLRAELAEKYVRREDAIREQVVINAKLDAIAVRLDNVALRGG